MTSELELKVVLDRLSAAREAVASAMRGAVLSRKRRAEYEAIERRILIEIIDIEEELRMRVRAPHSETEER